MATSKRNLYPKGQDASFAPYIGFGGNARAAMTFYAQLFGAADLQITTFADAPKNQRPPGTDDLVMHAQFTAAPGAVLMGCDIPPGRGHVRYGQHIRVSCRPRQRHHPPPLFGPGRRRICGDAACRHLLITRLWHGDGQVWHPLATLGPPRSGLRPQEHNSRVAPH